MKTPLLSRLTTLGFPGGPFTGLRGWFTGSALLLSSTAWATTPVVKTVGTASTADYASIGAALSSISGTLTAPVEIQLLDASYTEDVTITKAGTSAFPIVIRPAAGVTAEINGTLTFGANSRYVTISGDNGLATRKLTLKQTDPIASTVQFVNDASYNTLDQTRILGSCQQPGAGVVTIGNAANGGAGNDYNTLTGNLIAEASASALPTTLVYAFNLRAGILNDAIRITDNELANFTTSGLLVQGGNGLNWNISNNSFYYNAPTTPTTTQTAIDFEPGTASTNNVISDNTIGGRGASAGVWATSGAAFRGIVVTCGAGVSSTLSGNSISNVSMTNTSQPLTAMRLEDGRAAVADIAVTNVTNSGQGGVISLNSRAATDLSNFTVAQGQIVNVEVGGVLTITGDLQNQGVLKNAGDILVNGNFQNSASGTYNQTQGTLEIKGDMSNTGAFTSVGGLVKLTGNGAQLVSGGLYFNLEINGSGIKTITNNAEIISQLTLNNGVLATGNYTLTLAQLANLTETEDSYVLGKVQATRSVQANATQVFGGVGLEMTPASNSTLPGTTTVLRVTGTPITSGNGNQSIKRYFDITAATNSNLNLTLKMAYADHELNNISPANLTFFKSTDQGVNWMVRGITGSGPGYATLSGVDGFSRWTLGDVQRPLPVGLTAFRAVRQGKQALLTWTTANELNNRGFGVEVSTDGHEFRPLGFVVAQGGAATASRSYQFVDQTEGKQGLRYYRLRQEDQDGKSAYYGPLMVLFDAAPAQLAAYPTAFERELNIDLTSAGNQPVLLTLTDGLGRVVWQKTQPVSAGLTHTSIAPDCPAGTYLLSANLNGTVLHQRVVRQ